jgi:hypothetical protein|tara:strand:+ start:41 stop:565 length:525 start_codon:yes stop_codon:yes gene_type:complete
MTNINSKLESFENGKLIDIVKNYKQYGYDNDLRNIAVGILEQRGINKEQLELSGNFENHSYESAKGIHKLFSRNSKIAFILYGIVLITNILVSVFARNSELLASIILIINWISIILYFVFLVKSFMNQNDFYKEIGKKNDSSSILIYVFLGLPFYIFTYFYFRNQMNDELKMVK